MKSLEPAAFAIFRRGMLAFLFIRLLAGAVPVWAATFTVTNTNDSGPGSLRQAILDANANLGIDTIEFNIPGVGPHTIQPTSALPPITDPVVIDGYTQSGASPNTNPPELGSNAVLKIELDGSMAAAGPPPPSVHGLVIAAGGSTVRGLVINRFVTGDGIRFSTQFGGIGGEGGNVVEGNFIGTDMTGTAALGNNRAVTILNPNNTIGGRVPEARNVLSGNVSGVWMQDDLATGNLVEGNYIGTAADGISPLGNTFDGVIITRGGPIGAADNVVGGVASGAGNTIAFNGRVGVFIQVGSVRNAILSNSIFSNGVSQLGAFGLGIDLLDPFGVTPNDVGDGDTGPNNLQNFPVLTSATSDSSTTIEGTLNSIGDTEFRLEFFSNTACDPSGFGEGETFLGSTMVTTNASGDASFMVTFPDTVPPGQFITATATDPAGNTSEFSQCLAAGEIIGMVVDNATDSVTVFDAATDTVLGTVPIGPGINGDCSITADQTLGFATNFNSTVHVIDLTTTSPSLASGPNPIPMSNFAEDTSISPDGQFLVVCDGSATQPISVIDIATQSEVSTFALPSDCNSVDVCSDGSVLVTSFNTGNVHRLTIDGAGNLTDTGEVLFTPAPNNVFCAPGGTSGIVITRFADDIRSFTIPGLVPADVRPLSGSFGISGLVNPAGDRVFARDNGPGFVDVFDYNSITGALGATPLFSIPIADTPTFFGMDQMAVNPDSTKLYVSQPGALNVYDASNGNFLTSIIDLNIINPTGVCFASGPREIEIPVDIKPTSCRNPLNVKSKGVLPVAILGTANFDVTDVDLSTVELAGVAPLRSEFEDVATPFTPFTGKEDAFDCTDEGPDGFTDLTLKFDTQEVVSAIETELGRDVVDRETLILTLEGELLEGTPILGEDVVVMLKKGK